MTTCPKCGHTRKPEDQAPEYECPACGVIYAKFDPSVRPKRPRYEPVPLWHKAVVVMCLIIIPWSGYEYFFGLGAEQRRQAALRKVFRPQDHSISAFVHCKRLVLDRLKSPASADFPTFDYKAWDLGDNTYVVKSYVDSQNGFGAKVRTDWHCKVQNLGGGSWYDLEVELVSR